ncbi:hypothetical protein KSF_054100 [Reticulibacter mediterranei]|uniref:Asl1-like glycosyl hydrolase catalytic domain-containing protein n=1 Tax=Reticulibacter mediterranei TaxID=2778369 RepID=A0A8J3N2D3_9CHLR|nr:hypothetical protein [Reticulibacter mediterranei]GHO95362.1 hypothetical protein KSF_054100 [Reticulibacter mediterranei]
MTPNPQGSGKKFTRKQLGFLFTILGAVLAIVSLSASIILRPHQQPLTSLALSPTPSPSPATNPVSPLIFGTNMSLFASATTDQMLDSPATQKALQQIHVQMIRMPIRPGVPEAVEIKAAQAIKKIGAVPLVILNGPLVPDPLSVDRRVVQDMKQVFGSATVYYEFGNEEDLQGISMQRYTASWNTIIPQLKQIDPKAHFIGPVSYKYDRANLTAFLQQTQPKPDEISWHEYVCGHQSQANPCIAGIDGWVDHIRDARDAMQQIIGHTLPIMITEWNYAPDLNVLPNGRVNTNDGKHDNAAFMSAWTEKALQTLAANHVFASMQYAATNTPLPLIGLNDSITPQGAAFQRMYQQIITNQQAP